MSIVNHLYTNIHCKTIVRATQPQKLILRQPLCDGCWCVQRFSPDCSSSSCRDLVVQPRLSLIIRTEIW